MAHKCNICGAVGGGEMFSPHRGTKSGYQPTCRACCGRRKKSRRPHPPSVATCIVCGVTGGQELFYLNRYNKTGLRSRCKCCYHKSQATYSPTCATCVDCGVVGGQELFYLASHKTTGLQSRCINCTAKQARRNRYGTAIEEWLQEDPECEICGVLLSWVSGAHASHDLVAHIDHDHETGRARGVLCHRCNKGIGMFNEEQSLLWKAMMYLARVCRNEQETLLEA